MDKALTNAVTAAFREHHIAFSTENIKSGDVMITTGFNTPEKHGIMVNILVEESCQQITVFAASFLMGIKADQLPRLYPVINRLNQECRELKFIVEDNNDLTAFAALPAKLPAECAGEIVYDTLCYLAKVLVNVYPELVTAKGK